MAYSTCMNNENHYGKVCDSCSCCDRCCECADSSAGVSVQDPSAGLREVLAVERKQTREYSDALTESGSGWAVGAYKIRLTGDLSSMAGNHGGKTKTVERWLNSSAEEADLFARWAAKGIVAKRGRFVGR